MIVHELAEFGDVIVGLLGELRRTPLLATAMEEHFIASRRAAVTSVFERARDRGELTRRLVDYVIMPLGIPAHPAREPDSGAR
ncbi:TetR-like C-terminal domain-containing protein [Nonomuraea turkmeniaca]|uniref:TetR-like C-terminal domain-containing protein n=1 Tax=Nonomuraea turkmeniaca TaxID=103838 RepID=UPI001476D7E9|nr:TetR-like C-terminal domain-containing protein [Nonomuraea turkmeniaca]